GKVFGGKNLFPIIKSLSSINEIKNKIKSESTILGLDRELGWYLETMSTMSALSVSIRRR
ncbi:MAG: hypothetical protein P9L97_13025, partial [Candidatus Tenebribacter davisii]|nr:hypothetical protein [Candidatus Tenebribacter davisii]